ncbi:MAG: DEAD/DEAH box helicase [bacterium]
MKNPSNPTPDPQPGPLSDVTLEQLPESLRNAATRAGWTSLMPVQARAIPYLLAGRDMMIQARTGSGKTGAFLLPMLERLDPMHPHCQALVLVPTRELARQVWKEAETLCGNKGLRSVAVYGGVGYGPQIDALRQGAHVVIGTPGRVLDHLLKGPFSLKHLRLLIFDEADRMLSMGFYPDMRKMQSYLPRRAINTCMLSATFPIYVMRTAREFIREPEFLSLSGDQVHVTDTEHIVYTVPGMDRERSLVRLIETENPASAIIFCNTKDTVHYVSVVLQRFGYDADELTANLSQKDRERVLQRVRQGTLRLLVATDVAARGLDIPDLSHVIQYEPPEDPESYIHRAGRTGRAGATGIAISLVSGMEMSTLGRIAKRYGIDLQERPLPTDADVETVVTERLTTLLEARLRERDKLQTERSLRFVPLARTLIESEDESAIIAMLLDDYYQQMLHAPLAQPPDSAASSPQKPQRSGRRRRRGNSRRQSQRTKST